MGMPVTVEITDPSRPQESLGKAFDYFLDIDQTFSTDKKDSEISRIHCGELQRAEYSEDMKLIFELAEQTKRQTDCYFDIRTLDGSIDPSGIMKEWAINKVADLLRPRDHKNFYVEAGGDIQAIGKNSEEKEWRIGVQSPFKREEIVKVVYPQGSGITTSGTTIRGGRIYGPHTKRLVETDLVSLTVIGPNVYEADRFATAAFAMGASGINFIENLEGYAIDTKGTTTMTSGFETYTYDKND